jgi:hypothetical protein
MGRLGDLETWRWGDEEMGFNFQCSIFNRQQITNDLKRERGSEE